MQKQFDKEQSVMFPQHCGKDTDGKQLMGLTPRVVILLVVFSVIASLFAFGAFITPGAYWGTLGLVGMGNLWLPNALGLTVLLVMSLIAFKAKPFAKKLKLDLTPAELLTIYVCTGFINLMASGQVLLSFVTFIGDYANQFFRVVERRQSRYQWVVDANISKRLFPWDSEAASNIFMGGTSVTWSAWILPLAIWFVYFAAVFFIIFAFGSIFHNRWVNEERLRFPLVVPVTEMTKMVQGTGYSLKNGLFIAGLLVPILFRSPGILHKLFPAVPALADKFELTEFLWGRIDSGSGLGTILMDGTGFHFIFWPFAIGIGYLVVASGLAFSVWFFYYVYRFISKAILVNLGLNVVTGMFPYSDQVGHLQTQGGYWAIGLFLLWMSRHSIIAAVNSAFGQTSNRQNDTVMNPKLLVFGTIIAVVFVVLFGVTMLGVGLHIMVFILVSLLLTSITVARMRADAGFPYTAAHHQGRFLLISLSGVTPTTTGAESMSRWLGTHYTFLDEPIRPLAGVMGFVSEGLKMSDEAGMKPSSMLKALGVSVVLLFTVTVPIALTLFYRMGIERLPWKLAPGLMEFPGSVGAPVRHARFFFLFGVVVTYLLYVAHLKFVWWPLHPLGYIMAQDIGFVYGKSIAGSFFISWLIKTLFFRWFGKGTYERFKPFFVAMILGDVAMAMIGILVEVPFSSLLFK